MTDYTPTEIMTVVAARALRNDDVRKMLGSIEGGHVIALLEALAEQDGAKLLQTVAAVAELTPDFNAMLAEMLMLLQRIALIQDRLAEFVPEAERAAVASALFGDRAGLVFTRIDTRTMIPSPSAATAGASQKITIIHSQVGRNRRCITGQHTTLDTTQNTAKPIQATAVLGMKVLNSLAT